MSTSNVDPTPPQQDPTPPSPAGAGQPNPEAEPQHSASGVAPETGDPALYHYASVAASGSGMDTGE